MVRPQRPGESGRRAAGLDPRPGSPGLGPLRRVGNHRRGGDPSLAAAQPDRVHLDRTPCNRADAEPHRAEPSRAAGVTAGDSGRDQAAAERGYHQPLRG